MFSHIIIFGSSLPELLGGHSLCVIICGRVLIDAESTANRILVANHRTPCPPAQLRHDFMLGESGLLKMEYNFSCLRENSGWQRRRDHEPTAICCGVNVRPLRQSPQVAVLRHFPRPRTHRDNFEKLSTSTNLQVQGMGSRS
jgi:hypothetical protein